MKRIAIGVCCLLVVAGGLRLRSVAGQVPAAAAQLTAGQQAAAAAQYPVNQSAAETAAATFAQAVGWPWSGTEEVRFEQRRRVAPRWSLRRIVYAARDHATGAVVTPGEDITIGVDARTGLVCSAYREVNHPERTTAEILITKQEAEDLAAKYLALAGYGLQDAEVVSSGPKCITPNAPGNTTWEVDYARVQGGYRFAAGGMLVSLDPVDGSLIGLGRNYEMPAPQTTAVTVSKGDAVRISTGYMTGLGYTVGAVKSEEIRIVRPDNYWEVTGTGTAPTAQEGTSLLAWVIEYDAPWEATVVYTDAATGHVVGGAKTKSIRVWGCDTTVLVPGLTPSMSSLACGPAGSALSKLSVATLVRLISTMKSLRPIGSAADEGSLSTTLEISGHGRKFIFGYSPKEHRLALLEKVCPDGTKIECRRAWETSPEFEALVSRICAGE